MKTNSNSPKTRTIFWATVLAAFAMVACGAKKRPSAGQPYRAIVIALLNTDANGDPHFGLVERSFANLNNLDDLDGTYLKILRGGELSIREVNGSIVAADSFSGGDHPNLRYTLSDGVVVPSDYSTLAMLSSFYQFDYIYANVNDVLGVAPADLQTKLPGGKHTVLFEPQIVFKFDDAEGSAGIKLNAAFSPKDKQFLMFQRSGVENIPLSGNLQVLSHEFGHYVFDYAFLDGVYEETNYLASTFALSGLNEGWADFVSWNFTQSPDILRSSIAIEDIARERHITKTTFVWSDLVSQSLDTTAYEAAAPYGKCADSFYCIGTLFARSLLQTKEALTTVDQKSFANAVLVSLKGAQTIMKDLSSSVMPTANSFDSDLPGTTSGWAHQGKFTGAFLHAIVKGMPSTMRSTLCTKLDANFGTGGFPTAAREGVCP